MTEFIIDNTPPADDAPQKEKERYKLETLCVVNLAKFKYLYKDFLKSKRECEAEQRNDFFDQMIINNRNNFIKDLNRQFIKNLLFSFIFFIILTPAIERWLAVLFRFRFENSVFFYLYSIALSILTVTLINAGSLKKELVYSSEANALKEVVSLRKNIFLPVLYILISYLCWFMAYLNYYEGYHVGWGEIFTYTIRSIIHNTFTYIFFFILLKAYLCYRPIGKLKNEAKQEIEKYKRYLARDDELKKKSEQLLQQLVQFFPNLKKECDLSPELFDYYFDCDLSSVSDAGPASDETIELYDKVFEIHVSMILDRFKPAIYLLEDGKVATAEEALLTAYQQRDLNEDDK